ncbi:MAG: hypothetical protein NZT92_13830 [Abditibacteriales bacterium]|nr:hypothetical protein [Abditibacteriales bacterium]MDW8366996.1 hypothetical protein [Abditibacteriales bacterium]
MEELIEFIVERRRLLLAVGVTAILGPRILRPLAKSAIKGYLTVKDALTREPKSPEAPSAEASA